MLCCDNSPNSVQCDMNWGSCCVVNWVKVGAAVSHRSSTPRSSRLPTSFRSASSASVPSRSTLRSCCCRRRSCRGCSICSISILRHLTRHRSHMSRSVTSTSVLSSGCNSTASKMAAGRHLGFFFENSHSKQPMWLKACS